MVKKNAIMRYKILDSLLSNRNRYYSISELLEKVNEALELDGMEPVSRRCIEKDLNTLECAPYEAVIERVWYHGKKCIRYAEEGFSIFTKKLTEEEENLLSEVLNTIGQFDGLDTFEWLDSLKKRLDIKEHRRIILFDSNPYLTGKKLIGTLFTAISNKCVISLKYHSFKNSEANRYVVNPYLLKEYNNRWFLIAGYKDGTIRNFALDRIEGFEIMSALEYIEPDEDMESRFDDIVGVTLLNDMPTEDILLWVNEEGYQYVKTKPLHGSQRDVKGEEDKMVREKYPALQGGRFFRLQCILNYELKQLLMSKMDQLVVLEPATLKDDLVDRIKRLNSLYSSI
ncbi:MAG: WYL domain-containing protein [Alistipes sp.]|nr:WYL domain-containing protein [Alistipes sp.]